MNFTLTFDDGPSEWTPAILDLLFEHDAHAMFFVTGANTLGLEHITARASDEGHRIGVHGWSHRRLTALTEREIRWDLGQTALTVEMITGVKPSLFRAPFFDTDLRVDEIALEYGLTHFGADLVPEDWMAVDAEKLAGRILAKLADGSIVSLHDGVPPDGGSSSCTDSRAVTVEAVRLVLEATAALV